MKPTGYVALALSCFITTSFSAPILGLDGTVGSITGVLGSITSPSAGNDNFIGDNGVGNGNNNGNSNSAGNGNGNGNSAGNSNQAGSGNTITPRVKARALGDSITGILGSITNPSAGVGNTITGNGADNGTIRFYVWRRISYTHCIDKT